MAYFYHVYILKIYVETYYDILKNDKCNMIHAKCTIWTISTNPRHDI